MTKRELMNYLGEVEAAEAKEVAVALGVPSSVAAMALLRLVRQGLASRFVDPKRGIYWYCLSDRGEDRLAYLRTLD